MQIEKPVSESLFEEYLISQSMTTFEFEKVWEGIPTRPDYTVQHNGAVYLFDVKQFENQTVIPRGGGGFAIERYGRIRQKIDQVRSQLKYFKDKPCCLVLYTLDPFIRLQEPSVVLGAMYGDLGYNTLWDMTAGSPVPDSTRPAFLRNGKMFRSESRRKQNQTISALITLRQIGRNKGLGVIVWENDFARIRFPREIFRGPYDSRWGREGDRVKRVFAGDALLDFEEQAAQSE